MKNMFFKSVFVLIMLTSLLACSGDSDSSEPIICDPGFAGDDCLTKLTPTSIRITSVDITDWPATDTENGTLWDPLETGDNSRPDIYFALYKNGSYFYIHGSAITNANPATTSYTLNLSTPVVFTNFNSGIILELRDFNASNNTYNLMGSTLPFFIYEPTDSNFPATITVSNPVSHVEAVLHLSYVW